MAQVPKENIDSMRASSRDNPTHPPKKYQGGVRRIISRCPVLLSFPHAKA